MVSIVKFVVNFARYTSVWGKLIFNRVSVLRLIRGIQKIERGLKPFATILSKSWTRRLKAFINRTSYGLVISGILLTDMSTD